jgi:hypothetical protein
MVLDLLHLCGGRLDDFNIRSAGMGKQKETPTLPETAFELETGSKKVYSTTNSVCDVMGYVL